MTMTEPTDEIEPNEEQERFIVLLDGYIETNSSGPHLHSGMAGHLLAVREAAIRAEARDLEAELNELRQHVAWHESQLSAIQHWWREAHERVRELEAELDKYRTVTADTADAWREYQRNEWSQEEFEGFIAERFEGCASPSSTGDQKSEPPCAICNNTAYCEPGVPCRACDRYELTYGPYNEHTLACGNGVCACLPARRAVPAPARPGPVIESDTCLVCMGSGAVVEAYPHGSVPCSRCEGTGIVFPRATSPDGSGGESGSGVKL
jgi:hypothetical protein